jgi:uncharacterized protein YxjI
MRIDINQQKISIGDKYKIYIDGHQTYTAASELFKFLSVINLLNNEGSHTILKINKLWSWFKPKYNITLYGNRILEFRSESFWKMHYQCQNGMNLFDIYGHRGRKYSIYKNDNQIAWWEKQAVTWFNGDNYSKLADNGSNDVELIIAFCLIIDNFYHADNEKSAVKFDIGNIGGQVRKFNPGWQPNEKRNRSL